MQQTVTLTKLLLLFLGCVFLSLSQTGCSVQSLLPTRVAAVMVVAGAPALDVPPTFTPPPPDATIDPLLNYNDSSPLSPTLIPSITPIIPTSTPSPTPTYTPSPTFTPSATRPPTLPTAAYPYPFVIDPSKSKVSIHVIRPNSASIMEFVRQTQPNVIKLLDDFGWATEIKSASPGTIIVGRFNTADQSYNGNPEEEARKFVESQLSQYRANPAIDYWEGWNEPDPGPEHMAWYARFEQERVREMARYGFRTAIGGFSTGVPEVQEFALFLPAIETALQYRAILTLHEYGAPVITQGYGSGLPGYPFHADRGSLTLRYRWYYRELLEPAGLVIPLVITEAGIDGTLGDRPGPNGYGWADFQQYAVEQGWGRDGIEAFVNQIAWYDAEVRKDNYVLGFTLFTAGSFGHWEKYEIAPVLPYLTDYARDS